MFSILLGAVYLQHAHTALLEGLAWLHMPTSIHNYRAGQKILLVSPEATGTIVCDIEYALERNGYSVHRIYSTHDINGLDKSLQVKNVILNGWLDNYRDYLQNIQDIAHKSVPFLVIGDSTEANSGSIAVAAIEAGAVAFIPWTLGEGLLMAHLRRLDDEIPIRPMELSKLPGQIQLDPRSRRVSISDQELYLPKQLFRLFEYMVTHPDEAISYHQLLQVLAEGKKIYIAPNTLVVKIYRLRRILEDTGAHRWLETIPGFGYRFCPPKHIARLTEQSTQ